MRGWLTQQIVKLAMAERVESDFYLTLDADVICTRTVIIGWCAMGERRCT